MLCPYPTTCIYDRYLQTGVHFCAMPVCQFQREESGREAPIDTETLLRQLYEQEPGGDAMSGNRGGGHAPPDG